MAKKGMSNGKDTRTNETKLKNRYSAEFIGFVNYEPTSDDREAFVAVNMDARFWEFYQLELDRGRKLGVSHDYANSSAVATLMERDKESPNAGLILSCRGKTGYTAMARLLFLSNFVLVNGWRSKPLEIDDDQW